MGFRLVVAAADPDLAQTISNGFEANGAKIAAVAANGKEALEKCEELRPQGLVCSAFLPVYNADDLSLLTERRCPYPLVKLGIGDVPSRAVAARFFECGGDFFFVLPMDFRYVLYRMEALFAQKSGAPSGEESASFRRTVSVLRRMKMLPSYKGFEYIPAAVELILKRPAFLEQTVRELYPAVARRFGTTAAGVERCIRTALELTMERGDADYIYSKFGHAVNEESGKISNKEFLALLADFAKN